jgi:formylglycine-generating enzyme required for sulfatase activity
MPQSGTKAFCLFLCAVLFAAPLSAFAVTIDTVPVGNAGNSPDPETGHGAVAYQFRMGRTEVTLGQYAAFLNAVAVDDTYFLYNSTLAEDHNIAGIARSGFAGHWTYSVIGSPNKPVTYVGWADAARFANWLHNGQPSGPQNASTTEDGAYTMNGATGDPATRTINRNPGAKWFIPSLDEWYKAAYHKNDGPTGNYWDYPLSTDSLPYSAQPPGFDSPDAAYTGNFYNNDGIPFGGYDDGYAVSLSTERDAFQNYLTDVGAYSLSLSPYGTFDQGGNVGEWTEERRSGGDGPRNWRGGSWFHIGTLMKGLFRESELGDHGPQNAFAGFRVATVPEPSTLVLAAVGLLALIAMRWRRKR